MTGEQIRKDREKLKLKQKDLALKMGVHIRTIQKWELGERNISKWNENKLQEIIKG